MSKLYDTGLLDVNNYLVEGTAPDTFPVSQLIIAPVVAAPSLDLNFAAVKALDSRISFTRGSIGTYINSSGLVTTASSGVARFTHDPITLQSLGLLVEESRTNLITQSAAIGASPWITQVGASATQNQGTAPDGTNTASTVSLASSQFSSVYQQNNNSSAGTFTMSVWVRVSSGTGVFYMGSYSGADGQAYSSAFTATTTWQRFTWTRTVTAVSGWYPLITGPGTGGNFLAWGAQLEAGAFATSYIPTTTASATRAADVVTMTSTNFSAWFNSTEGSLVASGILTDAIGSRRMATFGGTSLAIGTRTNATASSILWRTPTNYDASTGTVSAGNIKQAFGYSNSTLSGVTNGGTVGTNTPPTPASATFINIGSSETGFDYWNGSIARIRYYRRRLTDTNLKILST